VESAMSGTDKARKDIKQTSDSFIADWRERGI